MKRGQIFESITLVALATVMIGCTAPEETVVGGEMSDQEIDNLVRRSYQYVAMYTVNNKMALKQGGWNRVEADTELKDHTMKDIARPNKDTHYITAIVDLRKEPVILEIQAFDSD